MRKGGKNMRRSPTVWSLIEVTIGIILAVLLHFVANQPMAAWTVLGVSALLAFSTHQVLSVLSTRFEEHAEFYDLLTEIDDPELKWRASAAVDECRDKLKMLRDGMIRLSSMDAIMHEVTRLMNKMEKGATVLAIHLSDQGTDWVKIWKDDPRFHNFLKDHEAAIQRGVDISRIFILSKKAKGDQETALILKEHEDIGVSVHIVWAETIDDELKEDLLIFDDRALVKAEGMTGGRVVRGTMTTVKGQIQLHKDKFNALLRSAVNGSKAI
jgi:hypothetical protein